MSGSQDRTTPAVSAPWRFRANFDTPVLVTGLPRSGTSMVAGALGRCGLWLGRSVPGDKNNFFGYFENIILRENVQKEVLRQGNVDPHGVDPLPPSDWRPQVGNLRDIVAAALTAQEYDGRQAWGFKDAKLTLTWRIWDEHFPQARWIVVRRPSDEIVASCLRTGFMRRHSSDPMFWRAFVAAYLERLDVLKEMVGWCRVVDAVDIVNLRFDALERLVGEVGLEWRPNAVRDFIAPGYWKAAKAPSA
jgi:hypothetical protein